MHPHEYAAQRRAEITEGNYVLEVPGRWRITVAAWSPDPDSQFGHCLWVGENRVRQEVEDRLRKVPAVPAYVLPAGISLDVARLVEA